MRLPTVVNSLFVFLALASLGGTTSAAPPKTLLLLAQGPDNHPAGTHEYLAGLEQLAKLLEPTAGLKVRVVTADEPWTEGPALLSETDGVVMFLSEGARWTQADPRRQEALARLAARGGGLVALHWALGTKSAEPIEPFLKLLGGCHGGPDRKYHDVDTELRIADPAHPIVPRGPDGNFWDARGRGFFAASASPIEPRYGQIRPILQATIDGRAETVAWSWERP